jgi:polar amino acid transport system ATP-binding protein
MRLELEDVSKVFQHQAALDRISLATGEVQSLVVIGPSGGGKSTLLRIIGGLEYPDSGSVTVNGRRLPLEERDLIRYRRTVGTVFQSFNLFPHLDALENIILPLMKVHGYNRKQAEESALELLERFHLADHAAKKPYELSGGERQRVAIARAVSARPQILLFDEPTSALDPEMTAEVLEMIEELKDEGRDLIIVTHEMGFARAAGDQVIFLAEGRIVEHGPARQVLDQPAHAMTHKFLSRVMKY